MTAQELHLRINRNPWEEDSFSWLALKEEKDKIKKDRR
jgi:hypothetical protein